MFHRGESGVMDVSFYSVEAIEWCKQGTSIHLRNCWIASENQKIFIFIVTERELDYMGIQKSTF